MIIFIKLNVARQPIKIEPISYIMHWNIDSLFFFKEKKWSLEDFSATFK